MNIIGRKKIWFLISGIAVVLAILSLIFFGLRLGIDFKGGTLFELEFTSKPDIKEVREVLSPFNLGNLIIQPSGEKRLIVKSSNIDQQTYEKIKSSLEEKFGSFYSQEENQKDENQENKPQEEIENNNKENKEEVKGEKDEIKEGEEPLENKVDGQGESQTKEPEGAVEKKENIGVQEIRYESVGPTVGKDLTQRAILSLIFATICVILYIAWAFRKVSKPIVSWKFGICAILALIHDVLITLGIFSILGKFQGVEIETFFVVALLTIIGYSVNDTVVIFDRVRENLRKNPDISFEKNVNNSVIESITRSLNTMLTTLFALFALFLFGGETIHFFVLALIVGFIAGTYSSIFIASPLLVVWRNLGRRFVKTE